MLKCFKCGEEKQKTCFYKEKRTKTGYMKVCKDCYKNTLQKTKKQLGQ